MKRKIIEASEGMILTNSSIYGRKIYLAEDADETEFKEITKEQYEKSFQQEAQENTTM